MKKRNKAAPILIALIIVVGIALSAIWGVTRYVGFGVLEQGPSEFEECLMRNDITLYINTENPPEVLKYMKTYDYLDSLKIVNCKRLPKACSENEVTNYPTWIINGVKEEGNIATEELAKSCGCDHIFLPTQR
jgi:hypothetical protein